MSSSDCQVLDQVWLCASLNTGNDTGVFVGQNISLWFEGLATKGSESYVHSLSLSNDE